MIKKYYILVIAILVLFTIESLALGGTNMKHKLKEIDKFGVWKNIWCDGYRIHLCILPFYKCGPKLFEVEDRKFMRIGHRELSSDTKKIAFTLETYKSRYQDLISIDLYIMNSDGTNLIKLPTISFKNIFLIGFLGNDKLVFENSEKENYLTKPGTSVIYILDLNTKKIDKFANQEISINSLNASFKGDLLIYPERDRIIIYNIEDNAANKLNIKMEVPVLSPDSKKILFRDNNMMGNYYVVNINGTNKELILTKEKIKSLLRGSGDYRDLRFINWAPDSNFVLLGESSDLNKGKMFVLDIETKEVERVK